MGLFALLTRWLPPNPRREERVRFAAQPRAPRKLERRRVLDAAGAGILVPALLPEQPYLQVGENLPPADESFAPVTSQAAELSPELPDALSAAPVFSVSLLLEPDEVLEGNFLRAVIEVTDTQPQPHFVQVNWGGGEPLLNFVLPTNSERIVLLYNYADDNPTATPQDDYTVTVTVTNFFGETLAASDQIVVRNVPPEFSALEVTPPPAPGDPVTLSGTYTDVGRRDTHQLDIDWNNDGTFDQTVAVAGGSFSVTRQIAEGDLTDITVRLRDDDGGQVTQTIDVVEENTAPEFGTLAITSPIDEHGFATLTGTYSDVDAGDTHELDIDWDGDGTFDQTVAVTGGAFSVSRQYLDDDPTGTPSDTVQVNVRLRDNEGGEATDAVSLVVNNVAPTFDSLAFNGVVDENGTATLSGTYSDVGTRDTHTLEIDWDGDGTYDQTVAVTGGAFSVSRQFLDDDPTGTPSDTFDVNVRLRDDDGGQATASVPLTIRNVAPEFGLIGYSSPLREHDTVAIRGSYSDIGSLDTHELDIDWDGDGTFDQTVVVSGGLFAVSRQILDDDPTGTPSDTFNVNLRLRDDDGGQATRALPLTVINVPPRVALELPAPIRENDFATLTGSLTDVGTLDTFTLDINWGDPLSPNNTQTFQLGTTPLTLAADGIAWDPVARTFTLEHQYLDDNPTGTALDTYTVGVTVTDDDLGQGTATTTVTVENSGLVLTVAAAQTVDEGALLDLSGDQLGSFTDVGSLDQHTATVDWGDGSPLASVAVTESSGSGVLGASHIYADNGIYRVTVTLSDDDTARVSQSFQVTVRNVDPTLTGTDQVTVDEGQQFTLAGVGVALEDPGFDNPANPLVAGGTSETFAAFTVDWGDGTAAGPLAIASRTNGAENVTTTASFAHAPHAYADNGTYTVSVVIRDDDGGLVTRTFTILVENVSPTLTLTDRTLEINEGETLDLFDLGIFTDPGYNNPLNPNGASTESFSYSIDWGDGTLTQQGQIPASVLDGQQGVATTGTLVDSHFYADNDADNFFTIQVTLFDDDGGFSQQSIPVRVLNVDPTLDPLAATDVTTKGVTTLTLSFADPGADEFVIWIDWGDKLDLPPADRFVPEPRMSVPHPPPTCSSTPTSVLPIPATPPPTSTSAS